MDRAGGARHCGSFTATIEPISSPKCCKGESFHPKGMSPLISQGDVTTLTTMSQALLSTGHAARTDVS